jgi:ribonuclease P protein component
LLDEKDSLKSYSLRKKKEFEELFKSGKRVANSLFVAFFLENEEKRVGLIVSKKVANKAVIRNRIRRRMREIYHSNREDMPQGEIVMIARKPTAEADFSSLKKAFLSLVKRI